MQALYDRKFDILFNGTPSRYVISGDLNLFYFSSYKESLSRERNQKNEEVNRLWSWKSSRNQYSEELVLHLRDLNICEWFSDKSPSRKFFSKHETLSSIKLLVCYYKDENEKWLISSIGHGPEKGQRKKIIWSR